MPNNNYINNGPTPLGESGVWDLESTGTESANSMKRAHTTLKHEQQPDHQQGHDTIAKIGVVPTHNTDTATSTNVLLQSTMQAI